MGTRGNIQRPDRLLLAEKVLHPFHEFVNAGVVGGILLIVAALIALIWANSPWEHTYKEFWESHFTIRIGTFRLEKPLEAWINDGLMAIFFFLVGLEIKREVISGELSSLRKATLPVFAAIGGMIFPALIFIAFNANTPSAVGWAIPMATDIAFALGVLALLDKRIPPALKVFLAAFAIVDDIGAVLVIAIFYTGGIDILSLVFAGIFLLTSLLANLLGVRLLIVYTLLGVGLWLVVLKSGVHATIAGILLAMTIPVRSKIDGREFVLLGRAFIDEFEKGSTGKGGLFMDERQEAVTRALETSCERIQAPLLRIEHALNPWVNYCIIPIFALANAGVSLRSDFLGDLFGSLGLGIIGGLVIGKQVGIMLFAWLSVKLGWSDLPEGVSWRQMYGASCLGGIGFTMSLFISNLAFHNADALLEESKIGILIAALIAGGLGWFVLWGASSGSASEAPQHE